MSENTKIEWATHTFNPWEGCQKVGPGCDHCYAETRNARFAGGQPINWGPGAPRRRTSASTWNLPLRWNAQHNSFFSQHGHRQRVFCASLADWLDNAINVEWLVDLLGLIRITPDLDWLLLSKRIGNWRGRLEAAAEWLRERLTTASEATVALLRWIERWLDGIAPANVWLGATIVNQTEADRDIPKLLSIPARARFLSMEPLLELVDLRRVIAPHCERHPGKLELDGKCAVCEGRGIWGIPGEEPLTEAEKAPIRRGLEWVIVGGESGPGARPMHPMWVRSLRDQCQHAGVPFLFKQWGEWIAEGVEMPQPLVKLPSLSQRRWVADDADDDRYTPTAAAVYPVGKKAAGRLLDGRTWDEVPG